jgi:lysophospholipase L1-like esterase
MALLQVRGRPYESSYGYRGGIVYEAAYRHVPTPGGCYIILPRARIRFMRAKVVLKELSKWIAATLMLLAIVEFLLRGAYFIRNSMVDYVPLVYTLGENPGPTPPWRDGFQIIKRDEGGMVWKARPNVRQTYIDVFSPMHTEEERRSLYRRFLPAIPSWLRGNPVWEISLNSEGFRDANLPKEKYPSAFRIICLGDSWTFGQGAGQEKTYPQRLRALLKQEFPEGNFEVFNLGVLGYATYNGLALMRRAIDLAPDVVVIAFAMNEPKMAGYADKKLRAKTKKQGDVLGNVGAFVAKNIEFYKLLRYWALLLKWKPNSIGEHINALPKSMLRREEMADNEKREPWVPVSLRDYKKHHIEMINSARSHGADAILLYNEFWRDSPYLRVLEEMAWLGWASLVDSSALIAEAHRRIAEELEAKLDLQPPTAYRAKDDGEIEVVFRVYADNWPVPRTMYMVGNHPKLGNLVPNKVAMYDDGTHGDQKAGDHVWSYAATFAPGTRLFYVYTNSGEEGKWEGLDVPHVRSLKVDVKNTGGVVYRPIESFGKIYMHADSWHTNADGYELIAQAMLEVLKRNEQLQEYLRRVKDD